MPDIDRTAVAWRLAAELTRARSETHAGVAVARAAVLLTGAESARVWMIDRTAGYRFAGAFPEEDLHLERPADVVARAVVFGTPSAGPATRPFRSRLVVPLMAGLRPLGAVELLEKKRGAGPFDPGDIESLAELVEAADSALDAVRTAASRERGQVEAITRLTRLFDIGRSFASTLDLERLVRVVVNRVQASLDAENAYLWLASGDGEKVAIAAASGPAAEAVSGWELGIGEGIAGRAAAERESILVEDPDEVPELEGRPDAAAGLEIQTIAAVPVTDEDDVLIGVLEVVNRTEAASFESGDLVFLREVASTTAIAIGNARRLDAERRASDLGSLLETAQELGASLDLGKVAFTLVHKAAAVVPYRRAAVGLLRGTTLDLAAVSGQTFVDTTLPEMRSLRDLLSWAAGLDEGIYVVQEEDGTIDTDRPETREKFRAYFEASGSRSFLTVPLGDDEGRLGVFALEAADPYAWGEHALEAARLLAVQATVAVRNATLYQQIPMARVFRPLARRKEKLLAQSRTRRWATAIGAVLLGALLILVPFPLRVAGDARILSDRPLPVTAEVEGRVKTVLVREGDAVQAGQTLATLDDAEYVAGAEAARTRYEVAVREQSRMRAGGQTAGAFVEGARLEGLRAEVALWEARLDRTRLRSAVTGVVATPRVEEKVGTRLARGDLFCEVVDPSRLRVEISLTERDVGLVREGDAVKLKMSAWPTRTLRGVVERVGVAATESEGARVFLMRARLLGAPLPLRYGMTGRAKIDTGRASLVRIVFRRPARWIWGLIWGWLP